MGDIGGEITTFSQGEIPSNLVEKRKIPLTITKRVNKLAKPIIEKEDKSFSLTKEYPMLGVIADHPNVRSVEIDQHDGMIYVHTVSDDFEAKSILKPYSDQEIADLTGIDPRNTSIDANQREKIEYQRRLLKPVEVLISNPNLPKQTAIDIAKRFIQGSDSFVVSTNLEQELLDILPEVRKIEDPEIRYFCIKMIYSSDANGLMQVPLPVDLLDLQTLGHERRHNKIARDPSATHFTPIDPNNAIEDSLKIARIDERSADAAGLVFARGIAQELGISTKSLHDGYIFGLVGRQIEEGSPDGKPFIKENFPKYQKIVQAYNSVKTLLDVLGVKNSEKIAKKGVELEIDPKYEAFTEVFLDCLDAVPHQIIESGVLQRINVGTELANKAKNQSAVYWSQQGVARANIEGLTANMITVPEKNMDITHIEKHKVKVGLNKEVAGDLLTFQELPSVVMHEIGHSVYFFLQKNYPDILNKLLEHRQRLLGMQSAYMENELETKQGLSFEESIEAVYTKQLPFIYYGPNARLIGDLQRAFQEGEGKGGDPGDEFIAETFCNYILEKEKMTAFAQDLSPELRTLYTGDDGIVDSLDKVFFDPERPEKIDKIYKALNSARNANKEKLVRSIRMDPYDGLKRERYIKEFGKEIPLEEVTTQ